MNSSSYRKRIRLPAATYASTSPASITIAVLDRRPVFRDDVFARACHEACATFFRAECIPVYAWTFMPDHAHFCLTACPTRSMVQIIASVKQYTTRLAWQHGHHGHLWQRSFFDHFLRADEDVETVCRYIWNNPVRAGIVADWRAYPYSGSVIFDLTALP